VEEAAVDAAMRAFWAHGYEGTSTQDLCDATGLGRSSIYNTFAGKRDLFDKALTRYIDLKNPAVLEMLAGELPIREKLSTLLLGVVDPQQDDPLGCLVVNTMVELGPHDTAAAERLRLDQEVRHAAFVAAIEAGQQAGEIAADKDAESLARFVVATIGGMRVLARGGADRAALESIATIALTAIF
jgi:AcrR family transcriptional regulator